MSNVRKIGSFEGHDVLEAVLVSGQHRVSVLNYGCVIRDWRWFDNAESSKSGRPLVLGFDSFDYYPLHSPSFGIIAGRVANRTAGGRFTLANEPIQLVCNEGGNHLHGGEQGLGKRLWKMQADEAGTSVLLTYDSPDGEQGYPGNVQFSVCYRLTDDGLACEMRALPDTQTPINLAQHNYYNLSSDAPDIEQHSLWVNSTTYLPVDAAGIPTGDIATVENTKFDFQSPRTIRDADTTRQGMDHNLILSASRKVDEPAVILTSPQRDIALQLYTDQPGVQLYTGAKLNLPVAGLDGERYKSFAGLCLEPQHFPDALNHPEWASPMQSPDNPYVQNLLLRIVALAAG